MSEVKKELMPVEMADGTSSRVTLFTKGAGDECTPVVLFTPAMGVSAEYYEPLAVQGAEHGWHFYTADLRGIGHSSVRASRETRFGYHETVHYDFPAQIEVVKGRYPSNPLFLMGHSLGGQLAALYIAANPKSAQGLILTASCSVWYKGWSFPHNFGVMVSSQLIRALTEVLGYFPGYLFRFGGMESKTVIRDWARQALTGRYEIAGSPHDFELLLGEVRIPLLAVSFQGDSLAPRGAVSRLYEKMGQASVVHWHLSAKDLGAPRLDHFKWVKAAKPLMERISSWIRDRSPCPSTNGADPTRENACRTTPNPG